MSQLSQSIWHFYFMYMLLAFAGLGTLPVAYTRAILNWFDEKRGVALGVALSGVGLGAIIMPPAIQSLIVNVGWQNAYLVLGFAVLLVSFPIAYFFFVERPEPNTQMERAALPIEELGMDVKEALHDRVFWILVAAFILLGEMSVGTVAHLLALLTDRGVEVSDAAGLISVLGVTLILGRVVCGYLVDRYFAPTVAFGFLFCSSVGIALLAFGSGPWLTVLAIGLLGLGLGAEFDLMAYLISRYMGFRAYGQLFGYLYAAFSVGAGTGPLLMGWIYDKNGSYTDGLFFFSCCALVAALLIRTLGPYRDFENFRP